MTTGVGIGTARARNRQISLPPQPSTVSARRLTIHPPALHAPHALPLVAEPPSVAAPPPLEVIDENQGVPDELYNACAKQRLVIVRVGGNTTVRFYPHTSAWAARSSFEEKAIVGATIWSKVPKNTKNFYYAEFAKKYKWRKSEDGEYRVVWETMAADRYRNWMNHLKTKVWQKWEDRPVTISAQCWNSFIAHWLNPKQQAISTRNAANRRGGLGDGIAPSMHTGGSKPHFVHGIDNTKDGVAPKHVDLYKALHQTKHHLPCNEKSKAILEAYDKRKDEDTKAHLLSMDDNELFFDVIGPPKKGRWAAAQTESSLTPVEGIRRFAYATSALPSQANDDNRVAERVLEIVQSTLNSTLNNTVRNVVLEMIGDKVSGTQDDASEHDNGDGAGMTWTDNGECNKYATDDDISVGEENRVGVDNDQFLTNILFG